MASTDDITGDITGDTCAIDDATLARLQQWQGRTDTTRDWLAPAPLAGLAATLDRDDPPPQPGDALPPLAHWLYFLPRHRQGELGPDGHARRGGFLPPVPLPRRMWAGGRLVWHAPLRVGEQATRVSTVQSVVRKQGARGDLVFVLVRHEMHGAAGLALTEEHDIVYRPAARPGDAPAAAQPAPAGAAWQRELVPDDVLLFRYSALTFNGHRIHYDRRYVTEAEGYPGLVVHGPLMATLLLDLLRRERPRAHVAAFSFRALRPVFDGAPLALCGQPDAAGGAGVRLWVRDHAGALAMHADATIT